MHDIESLASKLMNELKSMKDMVEDKLLFEAYRTSSLKNDADEVCYSRYTDILEVTILELNNQRIDHS